MLPPRFSNEASCIIHARIDALGDDGEAWWPIADPQSPDRAVKAFEGPVLRFLQRHHDLAAIDARLTKALESGTPPPMCLLYLAILRHRRGDTRFATRLVAEVVHGTDADWALRATGLAARLQAGAAEPTA